VALCKVKIMTSTQTHDSVTVKTATEADVQPVLDTIVLAFATDPTWRWNYPTPHEYLEHFPEFVRIYGGKAFDHETAYYVNDFAGAALWLPPEVHPDEDALVALFQETFSEERLEEAWVVLKQLDSYQPDEPFWHLPVIGVEPTQQRKGYGTALLRHVLTRCDHENTLAYLESSNPENIPLYARHGFEIMGMIQEEAMPPLIPMLREPQP
jgi:ribosomal protein S18 acetylase RimI-like enzyme